MKYSEQNCIITFTQDGKAIIEGRCLLSDKIQKVTTQAEDYEKWVKSNNEDIKKFMPYLSESEMKFLETGVTDEGWSSIVNKTNIPKGF